MFFVEAADVVRHFEQGVLRLEHEPTDRETLDRIFRGAHTLKGLSGMLRYDRIARFTHGLEDFLTRLRKGDLAVTPVVSDKLLAAADVLGTLVAEAREAPATSRVDLDEAIGMLGDGHGASVGPRPVDTATDGGTLRVATEKVDRLVDLVGELAVSQSMVAELVARIGDDMQFQDLTAQYLRAAIDSIEGLQEQLSQVLMVLPSGVAHEPAAPGRLAVKLGSPAMVAPWRQELADLLTKERNADGAAKASQA